MAESEKRKITAANWVFLGFMAIGLVGLIVALCLNWMRLGTGRLSEWLNWKDVNDWAAQGENAMPPLKGWGAEAAFAIISLVLSIISVGTYVTGMFVKVKALKVIALVSSILLIISAVATAVFAFICIGMTLNASGGIVDMAPGPGPLIVAVAGIIGGIFGIIASKRI